MKQKPGPKPLNPNLRLICRLHIGLRPEVYAELMQAVNETGLTPSQLLAWSWQIAKFEIMRSMAEVEIHVHESS
jgi:hypothetical protein